MSGLLPNASQTIFPQRERDAETSPPDQNDFYVYRALCTSVYDGDTVKLDISLGFGVWLRDQTVRLAGIDAWELRGEEREKGLLAKEALQDLIEGKEVIIRSEKDKAGKYGRYIIHVFLEDGEGYKYVNYWMIGQGHAVEYA